MIVVGQLTEDGRDDNGLDVLSAWFVGVSRKIGNVQSQSGVVTQDSVEICEGSLISSERSVGRALIATYSPRKPKRVPSRAQGLVG